MAKAKERRSKAPIVGFRAAPNEIDELRLAAKRRSLTVAAYVRSAALDHARRDNVGRPAEAAG